MNVIRSMSDKIIVLKNGKVIEKGSAESVFGKPINNYTKALINSII